MPANDANAVRLFIGGLAVGLVIGAGGVLLATQSLDRPQAAATRSYALSMSNRSRVEELLAAGNAHLRLGNYQSATAAYERVLTEFDCANPEALQGMKALAPDRLDRMLASCQEKRRS